MGKISYLMMGEVLATKYSNPGSPIINVQIDNTLITNTLIDLGASINVMTCSDMQDFDINAQTCKTLIL
jgi:hypothetical protein